jgi:hypothetical protein
VRTYLRDAYQRLGVDNRVALIHRLAALGRGQLVGQLVGDQACRGKVLWRMPQRQA